MEYSEIIKSVEKLVDGTPFNIVDIDKVAVHDIDKDVPVGPVQCKKGKHATIAIRLIVPIG